MRLIRIILLMQLLLLAAASRASSTGSIRGIVHDPQHRPVENAMVMLRSKTSEWAATANTDASGQFTLGGVSLGEYTVTVVAPAIGNAVFNAVGARVRGLPITAESVKAAMKKST